MFTQSSYVPVLSRSDKILSFLHMLLQLDGVELGGCAWLTALSKAPGTLPGTQQNSGYTGGVARWGTLASGRKAGTISSGSQLPLGFPTLSLSEVYCLLLGNGSRDRHFEELL